MASLIEPTQPRNGTLLSISHPEVSVVASTASEGWEGVQALIVDGRLAEVHRHTCRIQVVAFLLDGTTTVEWKRGGRLTRYVSEPGSLTIIPAGDDHQFRTDRSARVLVWTIDPYRLQSIAEQAWGSGELPVDIVEACNVRDAQFWALGQRLAARVLSPIAGWRMYREALNMQLALHLLWNYSSLPHRVDERVERAASLRLRRAVGINGASAGTKE
jgi:hypothetical protein